MYSTQTLIKATGVKLVMPFYHLISNDSVPHVEHLYPIRKVQTFEDDLDYFLHHFQALSLSDVLKISRGELNITKPSFFLSFDDGLSEFNDVIAPILLRKGVPATCFLNTDFIDNKGLFFRYKASLLLHELKTNTEAFYTREVNDWHHTYYPGAASIKESLLKIPYSDTFQLDELAELIDFSFRKYLENETPYLSSEQIMELRTKGFDFGAHSCDHPEYRFIHIEEQLRQTHNSIIEVARSFDVQIKSFAFPFTDFGVSREFFTRLEKEGLTDISFGGAGQKHDIVPWHFQRIPFEYNGLSAKENLNTELLYYIFKKPFGRNKISRA